MPFCAMPFYGAYFCGAPGKIPIGPAPIIAWLTNPPLSMAHQLMCTTEISLSVAHMGWCATQISPHNFFLSSMHPSPWIAFLVFKKSQKVIKTSKKILNFGKN
jgi:hypothetical protein